MSNLFGGSLIIKDGFSTVFGKFTGSLKESNKNLKLLAKALEDTEQKSGKTTTNMKNQANTLAAAYKKLGMSQSEAMKKAWLEVEKNSRKSSGNVEDSWVSAFDKITKSGKDSFDSLSNKIKGFSDSTLGTITKLSAGFLSFQTVKNGLTTGFSTASEYQNLRVMMNSLYGNEEAAEKKFKMASDYAQKTMFNEVEVVDALSTMKGVGLGDDEETLAMMGDLGSFAKSKNRGSIAEAVEAYADMMNGEWERMQTILNIKRVNLEEYAEEKGLGKFTNKQGQVTDTETLAKVFKDYVEYRGLTGLTEKMGDTATGKLSQTIGNLKKSLADLVGITSTGEIREGSMFQKFIQGLERLNNKITEFSNSPNFTKLGEALSKVGDAIYKAFSYVLDNPEVITTFLKLGAAMWALGKVGRVVSTLRLVSSAFSGLTAILAPFAPELLAAVATFAIARSIFAEDGILNKGISALLGKIPLVGQTLQEGFDSWTNAVREWFADIADWIREKLGFGKKSETLEDNEYNRKWYPEKFGGTVKYHTITDLEQSGSIAKVESAGTVNNNASINFNVDTIRETADVDELMDTAIKRLNKYQNTRNTLI